MTYTAAPTAADYIAKARELHQVEGEIEIDELDLPEEELEREVSRSEDGSGEVGAYVRAWVWVNREELQPGYDDERLDGVT